jgi:ATP-binding protein involved in chromosome partitioning
MSEAQAAIAGIRNIVAVGSGKGGVGKSTVALNLAVALSLSGARVGLMDGDIYGPSIPIMMGIRDQEMGSKDGAFIPHRAHGVSFVSMGFMIQGEKPLIWRGPMATKALQQCLLGTEWGDLDYLLIDLPPGTGDVHLTLTQSVPLTGAVLVSTPQDVALLDARKAIDMFGKLNTPILGMIENMSTYVCPKCGNEDHVFGTGGVRAEAAKLGVPLLAELPLALDVRLAGDSGTPIAAGDGPLAQAYGALAARLIEDGIV